MKFLLGTCILFFINVGVEGATPCCMPNEWSANIVETIGEYNSDLDAASLAYGNSDFYYDYTFKQMAYRQRLDNQTMKIKSNRTVILKYMEGKKYVIEQNTCVTSNLSVVMDSPCIPDDATHFGAHSYPAGVKVDVWFYADKNNGGSKRVGVTQTTCMPMTMSHITGGPDYVLGMNLFQNVTKGISDPTIFTVPSICTHAPNAQIKTNAEIRIARNKYVFGMEQEAAKN